MTAPIQGRADELADQTATLSEDTEQAVTQQLEEELTLAAQALIALWLLHFGTTLVGPATPLEAAEFVEAARAHLVEAMDPELLDRDALTAAQSLAYDMGALNAAETAPFPLLSAPQTAPQTVPDLGRAVDEALSQAIVGLTETAVEDEGFEAVTVALRRAGTAVSRIRSTVANELTAAVNAGVRDIAQASGSGLVWVAERDACLTCLAYAGQTVQGGAAFPPDLTFDVRPMPAYGPLLGPPRHPNCRCVLQPWHPDDTAVPSALAREAKRSVLRGWAHEGESLAARLRAAERLLAVGSGMPRSVEQVARRAVEMGRFPEDRPSFN